jgi:hypothetical protein
MDHMYIRHTVGGTLFLDTKKHNLTYELTGSDGKWTFTVPAVEEPIADALLKNKDELNLFVAPENDPGRKAWYYTSSGDIHYDRTSKMLTIVADVKFDYSV